MRPLHQGPHHWQQTEKEAAAGFAGDAKQAVAGVSQTASAAVNSALQTTFASIVSMRAVAGEARAKFELVALSDPSGSRAAGVLTGDLQSFDYAPAGGNVPGAFAHGTIAGIYVQHNTVGTGGNSSEVEIRKRRNPNRGSPRNAVTSTTQSGRRIVYLTDDSGTGENVTFKRADIANAIRGASFINQARPTATGDLRVAIANDGRNIDERVALITLSGGRAAAASAAGTGWRISRNGTAEFGAGVIRGKLKASQIDVTDLNAAGIVATSVNFGTATVTGTLSAAHIDSDVVNWTRLAKPDIQTGGTVKTVNLSHNVGDFDAIALEQRIANGTFFAPLIIFDRTLLQVDTTPSQRTGQQISWATGQAGSISRDSTGNIIYLGGGAGGNSVVGNIWGLNYPT